MMSTTKGKTMALTREELVDIVQTAIAAALVPIQTDLREIKTDVAELKTDVATLKTKMDAVGHEVKVLAAKQANSTKGRDDVLEPVLFPVGAFNLRRRFGVRRVGTERASTSHQAHQAGSQSWNQYRPNQPSKNHYVNASSMMI